MGKAIANRRPTLEEIEFSKRSGTVHEAERRIINEGGFDVFQRVIDDPIFLGDLLSFHREYVPRSLNYASLLDWLQGNKLEGYLKGGSLERQLRCQELFYQKFYGKKFHIDRSKIFITAGRLSAIKKGLETGCVDKAMLIATPNRLSEAELEMTEAEYAFCKIMEVTGIEIWAKDGRGRWTKRTLAEVLRGYVSVRPEDFNAQALEENWSQECLRVLAKLGSPVMQRANKAELIFVDSRVDIPSDQVMVNRGGELVNCDRRDFVTAVKNDIRIVTPEQEIILASQTFMESGKYLAINTWELNSALLKHEGIDPGVSVAFACSYGSEFCLYSYGAGYSGGGSRFRLAL